MFRRSGRRFADKNMRQRKSKSVFDQPAADREDDDAAAGKTDVLAAAEAG
jgi:hypothetical protein